MKFIRLDMIGHWRGNDHVSSMCGLGEESYFEAGISCYKLNNVAEALENLRAYWIDTASMKKEEFKTMQVTIFEGELLDEMGADWEDLAICERTLFEFNSYDLISVIIDKHEEMEDEEISEKEYEMFLSKLVS